MNFFSIHNIGDIVYLKTDEDQFERMITQVCFKGNCNVVYTLALAASESEHYEIEITSEKDMLKELNISKSNKI